MCVILCEIFANKYLTCEILMEYLISKTQTNNSVCVCMQSASSVIFKLLMCMCALCCVFAVFCSARRLFFVTQSMKYWRNFRQRGQMMM